MLPVQMRCCAGEPQRVSKECQPGPTTPASRPAGSDRVRTKTSGGLYLARHEKRLEFLRNVRGPVRDVKVADHEDEHLNERKKADGVDLVSGAMRGGGRGGHHAALGPGGEALPRTPQISLWFPDRPPIHGYITAMDLGCPVALLTTSSAGRDPASEAEHRALPGLAAVHFTNSSCRLS